MMKRTFSLGALALSAIGLGSPGCADSPREVGRVDVALVAAGTSGIAYRLPAGTMLHASDGTFTENFSLDGDTASALFDLPVSVYTIDLVDASGQVPASWSLIRQLPDGSSDTVPATLTMASSITVAANQTASLELRFRVATGEVIQFLHGQIQTTVVVDESTATSYDIEITGNASNFSAIETPALPSQVGALLEASGNTSITMSASLSTDGPWQQTASDTACATAHVNGLSASGAQLIADHFAQSAAPEVNVCLRRAADGSTELAIDTIQFAPGSTPTFADFGDRQLAIESIVFFRFPLPVFDGHTLDLAALTGVRSGVLQVDVIGLAADPGTTGPFNLWYNGGFDGSGSLTFTAR